MFIEIDDPVLLDRSFCKDIAKTDSPSYLYNEHIDLEQATSVIKKKVCYWFIA